MEKIEERLARRMSGRLRAQHRFGKYSHIKTPGTPQALPVLLPGRGSPPRKAYLMAEKPHFLFRPKSMSVSAWNRCKVWFMEACRGYFRSRRHITVAGCLQPYPSWPCMRGMAEPNPECQSCGLKGANACIDVLLPRIELPPEKILDPRNLQIMCPSCLELDQEAGQYETRDYRWKDFAGYIEHCLLDYASTFVLSKVNGTKRKYGPEWWEAPDPLYFLVQRAKPSLVTFSADPSELPGPAPLSGDVIFAPPPRT